MVSGMGIPVIPGSEKVRDVGEAMTASEKIGFPILLKASAGGGGRGIVIVREPRDLSAVFDMVSAEAQAAFGDGTLFAEKYIPNARHVEIQILADLFGNVVHLGERDCSIQRRYQKVIEEAPSPAVSPEMREQMARAAVTIAHDIHYENLGTVEFLLDQDKGKFYFLEMNTRIQVEHPVTEAISGVDLVQEQIRIADREPLSLNQEQVSLLGHAIECRINAENADLGFRPCPGLIRTWEPPKDHKARVDSHCYSGYTVPPHYDSLLAKLITSGNSRQEAIEHMVNALRDFTVVGVDTTIPFLASVVQHADFKTGKTHTRWLEEVITQKDSER
jgi:acetyl-CoA carboxylase biotin carboxylase subunit